MLERFVHDCDTLCVHYMDAGENIGVMELNETKQKAWTYENNKSMCSETRSDLLKIYLTADEKPDVKTVDTVIARKTKETL